MNDALSTRPTVCVCTETIRIVCIHKCYVCVGGIQNPSAHGFNVCCVVSMHVMCMCMCVRLCTFCRGVCVCVWVSVSDKTVCVCVCGCGLRRSLHSLICTYVRGRYVNCVCVCYVCSMYVSMICVYWVCVCV